MRSQPTHGQGGDQFMLMDPQLKGPFAAQ